MSLRGKRMIIPTSRDRVVADWRCTRCFALKSELVGCTVAERNEACPMEPVYSRPLSAFEAFLLSLAIGVVLIVAVLVALVLIP